MSNRESFEELKKKIEQADVVSFDVFDTLILRIVNTPETIFKLVGDVCGIKDYEHIRQEMQRQASMEAEEKWNQPHAVMDQIYDYIKTHSGLEMDWEKVKQTELEMEYDSLVANPEMKEIYEFAKAAGKRVIATSDMYLKKDFLGKVLKKCGYEMDKIYDSADEMHTKFRGDLYEQVQKEEGVPAWKIIHIGDNWESDVVNAQKAGFQTYHYPQEKADNKNMLPFSIDEGVKNCIHKEHYEFWENLGAEVGGPLYLGLFTWLKSCLKREKYEKIFFLARDGYNLYQLFGKYTDEKTEYLMTSRRALLLAGISKLDEETMQILPPFTLGQTIKEVLEYLGVLEICQDSIKEAGFESVDEIIHTREEMEQVKKLYTLNETAFLKKCEEERQEAYQYFKEKGFFDVDSIVFDCGWNGSSQYLLDRFLECVDYQKKNKFFYTGILNTEKSKRQLNGRKFETYLFNYDENYNLQNKMKDSIVIMELFFGAPMNSVYKYKDGGAVLEDIPEETAYKEAISQGIITFVERSIDFVEKYKIQVKPEHAVTAILRLIHEPTEKEAVTIGNIANVDGFANQKAIIKYIAKLDEASYKENPQIEIYWAEGLFKRPDIDEKLKKQIAQDRHLNYKDAETDDAEQAKESLYEKDLKKYGKVTADFLEEERKHKNKDPYQRFIKENETNIVTGRTFEQNPLISFVVPVYNVPDDMLTACIDSIIGQTYKNWELWLVDDFSSWESVREVLRSYETTPGVHVIYRTENGNISKATNDGIAKASGEYIAFMDCDDVIELNTLEEMVALINENPELDFIYSDEDKLTEDGTRRHSPFFKPDWSPDTFFSIMYTNHLAIYRTALVRKTGGLRTEYNGAQDYDFTLRFTELTDYKRIGHVKKVLYHWRERAESIAAKMEAKPYALEAMKRLKEETLERRGLNGTVEFVSDMYQYRVCYEAEGNPKVSIVIPSKDNFKILKQCIDSIKQCTIYENYEIIVVDNGSNEENKAQIESYLEEQKAAYIYELMNFNFSKMCNLGVKASDGEYILLLNDDIKVYRAEWLSLLVGQASLDYAGAVGAKLLYPETDIIQHIGIANLKIGPSHSEIGFSDSNIYYFGRNRVNYNWLAVTAACLMVKKSKYEEVGGLDEELTVAYNDVDFCFKLYEKGYYNSVRNDVPMYHYESISRGSDDVDEKKQQRLLKEREHLYAKHPNLKGKDPFYNDNLTQNKVDFSINVEEEEQEYAICEWMKHYPKKVKSDFKVCIDKITDDKDFAIEGWCQGEDAERDNASERYLLLRSEQGKIYQCKMEKVFREDVAQSLGSTNYLAGFRCRVDRNQIAMNLHAYTIGIMQKYQKEVFIRWLDVMSGRQELKGTVVRDIALEERTGWKPKQILHRIDGVKRTEELFGIKGWAVLEHADNINCETQILVVEGDRARVCSTQAKERYDVALSMPHYKNIYLCGFAAEIPNVGKDAAIFIVKRNLHNGKVYYQQLSESELQEEA